MSKLRDVVVVRVSEKGDREDEHFHSPEVQIEAARRWARDRGERLVASPIPEIDVSGRLPLSKRPGLLAAIEMIEAGRADQLVVAYFDRLVRSLKVQLEVIERVERAGGEIFALDHGKLTNGTAAQRLSTNMLGSVFQYFAEITGEKVTAAQARAVARGVYPHPRIPVGYVRGEDGVLVVEPAAARVVVRGVQAPRPGRVAGGDPGVAGRERDRARALRCGLDAALADVPGRDPLRRAAQHAALTRRSSRIAGCLSGCSGGRSRAGAKPSPSGCWPAWGAALRDVRVADGDQLRQRQLPLRRHEREPLPATSGGQGRPGRGDGAGRGPGVLGHGRPAPTRVAQAADPRGGRGDRTRQRGS